MPLTEIVLLILVMVAVGAAAIAVFLVVLPPPGGKAADHDPSDRPNDAEESAPAPSRLGTRKGTAKRR